MHLGVIADDFTGGTDIAGFLVQNGLSVTQYIGVPESLAAKQTDAAVISLKSRSCPAEQATRDSLAALAWLKAQGCEQVYFKYCSTFDSTPKGNIGPVTDALLDALGSKMTVVVPALPVNGRTVYKGYLFVGDAPLNESGMRHHPVTPMLDANLMRLMQAQSTGKAANMPHNLVDMGPQAIREVFREMSDAGVRYVVPDALHEEHLLSLGEAVSDMPLVTGGSGLAIGVARRIRRRLGAGSGKGTEAGAPPGGRCVILAGSASVMTNAQVARYEGKARTCKVEVSRCVAAPDDYAAKIALWVDLQGDDDPATLVYATAGPEELAEAQKRFGAEASGLAVERFFASLAVKLRRAGFDHFIVAGGETSGSVVKSLGVKAFHIGPQIAPGVPWVRAVDSPISLALKSGNFGDEDFFIKAQEFFQ